MRFAGYTSPATPFPIFKDEIASSFRSASLHFISRNDSEIYASFFPTKKTATAVSLIVEIIIFLFALHNFLWSGKKKKGEVYSLLSASIRWEASSASLRAFRYWDWLAPIDTWAT